MIGGMSVCLSVCVFCMYMYVSAFVYVCVICECVCMRVSSVCVCLSGDVDPNSSMLLQGVVANEAVVAGRCCR